MMTKTTSALLRGNGELAHDVPYREVIRSLLYFSMCTRPDIMYAVFNIGAIL